MMEQWDKSGYKKHSGFEDIPEYPKPCRHPEHNPPGHLVIPPSKQYRHVCPACGHTVVLRGSNVSL